MSEPTGINAVIAAKLRDMGDVLEQQEASAFRVRAYRRAAESIESLDEGVDAILAREGRRGLEALPGIGDAIAAAIAEMCASGRWGQLDRLTGALEPERLFRIIPGVGPRLAQRLHQELDIDTLEQLEIAAHDGRLQLLRDVGPRRAAAIRAFLAQRLGRRRFNVSGETERPSVTALLALDAFYRERAREGALPLIAPRRFNPSAEAWLPILHETRGRWRFTVLFSNTAQAHKLGKIHDWVVIYFTMDGTPEGRATVVTETVGPNAGKRVVRGRESECERYYGRKSSSTRGDRF